MSQSVANEYATAVSNLSPKTTGLSPAEFNTAMKTWEETARLHNGVGPDYDYGLAAAIGNVAHGLSWGVIPTKEASKGLASLFTGRMYNKPVVQYDPNSVAIQKLVEGQGR